ncbi:alkaline phosphatase family protein [Bacillus cereus]|uniref:alkaline phosphatase family protein n=1 Tax=Bacillus cereus TaxID=1396 RepID=UPI00065C171B|nr:alkaline phosphatase family protein [Bacillus cereus]KMQ32179.1 hypothetical protein TU58_01450 [Bacillus cereus]
MTKLMVAIFEGMNEHLLYDWIEEGYLPNFSRMVDQGVVGELNCNKVPYEAVGLVTAFSGLSEKEHGVLSYWQVHNSEYIPMVWESSQIKNRMFWNHNELKDYKFGVVNVFGTHPTYEINGFLISYAMKGHSLRFSSPPHLIYDLSKKGYPYVQDLAVFFSKDQKRSDFIDGVKRVENMRIQACKELLEQEVDVMIMNFTSIDRVSHFYTDELTNEEIKLEDKAIFRAYQNCDAILGELYEEIDGSDTNLIWFSEIGFGPLEKFVSINDYLAVNKFLKYDNENKRRPNWGETLAFESVQGSHGINLNRQSFYKHGIVRDEDFQSLREEVIQSLLNMPNPYNENQMFSNVVKGEEYYGHPAAPDIMVEPYDWNYLPYGDNHWADVVSRHSQTGWHRPKAVWGGIGPEISGKKRSGAYDLVDLVPTFYHLLDVQPPNFLKGKSLII